jgi:coenzyme F420-0:L-glutamate ligase/coenzyme F420-1:gamma-L-glutamate ligase
VAPGVVVSDSFGRPWRWGIVDVALGVAGFRPLDDQRGRPDTAGRTMHATVVAVADQLASTAELASGKTSGRPLVLVRGADLPPGDGSIVEDVVMDAASDMFR